MADGCDLLRCGRIAGAVLAAVPGLIDYFSIDETEMRGIANLHLAVNLARLCFLRLISG